jgi:hypothetical protein
MSDIDIRVQEYLFVADGRPEIALQYAVQRILELEEEVKLLSARVDEQKFTERNK